MEITTLKASTNALLATSLVKRVKGLIRLIARVALTSCSLQKLKKESRSVSQIAIQSAATLMKQEEVVENAILLATVVSVQTLTSVTNVKMVSMK